jgi:predicted DNA-binding protein (MmcQ/YjbR family)
MKTVPQEVADALRAFALRMPGAVEDHPGGDRVAKVNKKIFVFLGHERDDGIFQFCVKLPESAAKALKLPGAEPAGYGMGKHGWVLVKVQPDDRPDLDLFLRWVEESYRAVAPKKLVKAWDAGE